jgi:hypothetical protein
MLELKHLAMVELSDELTNSADNSEEAKAFEAEAEEKKILRKFRGEWRTLHSFPVAEAAATSR